MKTLKVRLKDKHSSVLNNLAREVNFVWNFVNDLSYKHFQRTGNFFSTFDIQKYTNGSSKAGLAIHSETIQVITDEYVTRRRQFKKSKLRWRVSGGARKSLGWVPFKGRSVSYRNGQLRYAGHYFGMWDSYGLSKYTFKSGSFNQDARGRWYANISVDDNAFEVDGLANSPCKSVGIDLGLKDFATLSDGTKIEAKRLYRNAEAKLAIAQRANKKQRVKAIHAKISNTRKDFHHKLSTQIVKENAAIFVGNVNAKGLAKTRMAKSVMDAGWSSFRTMLKYKSDSAGVWFEVVNEAYSTQTCSCCGSRQNSPKGREGLRIREWTCGECGITHDRDINAAMNILALGHERLAVGIQA